MINAEDYRQEYNGNDSATEFAYGFPVTDKTHVLVTLIDANDVETELTVDTDYTVGGVADPNSANWIITYPVSGSPLATGERLVIIPNLPYKQTTDYENQGGFFADTHEGGYDYLTILVQQLKEITDRCIKITVGSALDVTTLVTDLFAAKADAQTAASNAATSETNAASSASAAAASAGAASASAAAAAQSAADASVNADTYDKAQFATASGTDTYTASMPAALSAYEARQQFVIKFTNANTGASTLNIDSIGAKTIKKNGAALVAGDIPAGAIVHLVYDGTDLLMIGSPSSGGSIDIKQVWLFD